MPKVSTEYIGIGCNRTTHAAAWGVSGLVAFAASKLVALYDPLDKTRRGVRETLQGHTERVICVEFIEQGIPSQDAALVSGSADATAKIWKKNKNGEWINSATLQGHSGAVETIGVMRALKYIDGSPDLIATGSADGTIRIWEREVIDDAHDEVSMLQVIECGNKYPTALAMSYLPGSNIPVIACAHTDKKISVFIYQNSAKQFKKAHVLQGHDNWVRSLAFATYTGDEQEATGTNHTLKHGDLMLASGSQDKYIRLWKISPHKEAPKQPQQENNNEKNGITDDLLQALQESALTGENVLSTRAHIVDVEDEADPSRKLQYSLMFEALLMGHDDWVFSVCWERPRERKDNTGTMSYMQPMRLLSASSDKSMMIWRPDPATGVWVNEVRMGDIGGNSYLGFQGALFAPDGSHVLAHGANGSFHLWKNVSSEDEDISRWAPQVAISGHFKPVQSIAWDPKSRYLLSASLDQTTRLHAPWVHQVDGEKVVTWHETGRPQIHGYDLKCLSFVHGWQIVSGADEKVLRVFDAPQSCVKSLAKLTGHEEIVSEIGSRPVAANVPALGLSNKAVFEGDIQEMENAEEDHTMLQSYTRSGSSPASLTEVMDHPPFEEHLLQHTLWPEVEKLYGHGYEIISVEASHDGKYVASACKAATPEHAVVRIFETGNWKELPGKVAGHTLTVTRARFSHNDRWLLTASRDRMWCLSERKDDDPDAPYQIIVKNKAHARIIWDCSWSHDDRMFATGSRDKSIKIWTQKDNNSAEWVCVATIKCAEAVTSVEFAPVLVDDRYILAVGLEDGQLLLLGAKQQDITQWETLLQVERRLCHAGVVNSLSWRAQPLQLASAGDDNAVRILNVHI